MFEFLIKKNKNNNIFNSKKKKKISKIYSKFLRKKENYNIHTSKYL